MTAPKPGVALTAALKAADTRKGDNARANKAAEQELIYNGELTIDELKVMSAQADHLDWQLCFVDENVWAYFSNVEPHLMGGDNWNDAPHDCNASQPYPREGQHVVCVAYDGPYEMAGRYYAHIHPNLSADDINARVAPWLYDPGYGETYPEPKDTIFSGVTLREFIARMQAAGGNVYTAVGADDGGAS